MVGRRRGAHVDVVELVDAGPRERDADRGREVERGRAVVGAARDLGPEPVDEPVEEVGAELVARRVDARPEHRAHRTAGRHGAQRVDRGVDDALLEARPARVHDADRVVARRARSARSRR